MPCASGPARGSSWTGPRPARTISTSSRYSWAGTTTIPLGQHELYAAQEIKKAVAASFRRAIRCPHEDGLLAVCSRGSRGKDLGQLDTIAKLGTYLKGIQEADERFTGRAIKNITDAVKVRAMDFELPDEWMEKPDLFLFKSYDEKKAMISEDLRQPITVEMVLQEINRYADSEFRYADKSDEVAIENRRPRDGPDGGGQEAVSGGEGVSAPIGFAILVASGVVAWTAVLVALQRNTMIRRNTLNRVVAYLSGLVTLGLGLLAVNVAIVIYACGPSSLLRPLESTMCGPQFSAYDVFLLSSFATGFPGGILFLIMLLAEALRRAGVKS